MVALHSAVDFASPESMETGISLNQSTVFTKTPASFEEVRNYFGLMVLDDNSIQRIQREDVTHPDYFYDFTAIRQRPLYRLNGDMLIPIYFPFFRWRVTEGIYWDIWWTAKNYKRYGLPVDEMQFANAFGPLFERYIQDRLVRALPNGSGLTQRLWREPKIRPDAPAADLVIAYPDAFLFVEVKAARLKYLESMVTGGDDAIEDDFRQMVYEPAKQLANAIQYFQNGHLAPLGLVWRGEQIYPLVVTYGPLLFSTLRDLLHQDEGYCQLGQLPSVMPLEILDPDEATRLASLAVNGLALNAVLRRRQEPIYADLPFRTYLMTAYGVAANPNAVLDTEWAAFASSVQRELFGDT